MLRPFLQNLVCALLGLLFFSPTASAQNVAAKTAFVFNGSNYLQCGNPAGNKFDITGQITIQVLGEVDSLPPNAGSVTWFSLLSQDEGAGNRPKWMFGLQNGKLIFHINSSDDIGPEYVYSGNFTLQPRKDYLFSCTISNGKQIGFYVNGIAVGGGNLLFKMPNVNAPLVIGNAEYRYFYSGQIYEVWIWNKLLPPNAIIQTQYGPVGTANPVFKSLVECFMAHTALNTVVMFGQKGTQTTPKTALLLDQPETWVRTRPILILCSVLFALLCVGALLYMRRRAKNRQKNILLQAAQLQHENNNSISLLVNLISNQLKQKGLADIDGDLKQRLLVVTSLQDPRFISPDSPTVNFDKYAREAIDMFDKIFNHGKKINYHLQLPVSIKTKTAVKLAVLLRELTVNSLKHAFVGKSAGNVFISFLPGGKNCFRFDYRDDGVGFGNTAKQPNGSMGTMIINAVSAQLGATPAISTANGYHFVLMINQ